MDNRIEEIRARCEYHESIGSAYLDCVEVAEIREILSEVERYRQRTILLENYIKSLLNAGGCQSCIHDKVRPFGNPCDDCGFDMHAWEFDQGRFETEGPK